MLKLKSFFVRTARTLLTSHEQGARIFYQESSWSQAALDSKGLAAGYMAAGVLSYEEVREGEGEWITRQEAKRA